MKKEHLLIYEEFLKKIEAYRNCGKLNPNQEQFLTFILNNHEKIFKNTIVIKGANSLSKENFGQFLSTVVKDLATNWNSIGSKTQKTVVECKKRNFTDNAIQEIVDEYKERSSTDIVVEDVKGGTRSEAWGYIKKFAKKFMPGTEFLANIPIIGKHFKDENKKPLPSDDKRVMSFFTGPASRLVISGITIAFVGANPLILTTTILFLIYTPITQVKGLFSFKKEDVPQDKSPHFSATEKNILDQAAKHEAETRKAEDEKEKEKCNKIFSEGISEALVSIPENKIEPITDPIKEQKFRNMVMDRRAAQVGQTREI